LNNGHDFVEQAFSKGAAAALVGETFPEGTASGSGPLCRVPDTLKALEKLGVYARQRTQARIIAVTGSYGKTSTKEALKHVLSAFGKTYATERSFNNHWGVPLSLARLPKEADYGIFEIGMNHSGEIGPLSKMVKPDVALITTVDPAHIGHFDSLDDIATAKAEIFQGLIFDGAAVINYDNFYFEYLNDMAFLGGAAQAFNFGAQPGADIRLLQTEASSEGLEVTASIQGRKVNYTLPAHGRHWAYNSLAIIGVILALDLEVEKAIKAFAGIQPVEGRGKHHKIAFGKGALHVIDESYNAGPVSMRCAIEVLGQLQPVEGGRRIAVLGDMLELGKATEDYHRELADILKANAVDLVFTSGANMQLLYQSLDSAMQGAHNDDVRNLAEIVRTRVQAGDIIMIKGSRGQRQLRGRMYAVVETLLAGTDAFSQTGV
jgi:UDP-N-acetylmuramoyl-tripeptide--D-alanyl-D-alanine ligase